MSCLQIGDANDAVLNHRSRNRHRHQTSHRRRRHQQRDQSRSLISDCFPDWLQADGIDFSISSIDSYLSEIGIRPVSDFYADVSISDGLDLLDRRRFVMDLFNQRVEQSQVSQIDDDSVVDYEAAELRSDSGSDVVEGNCEMRVGSSVENLGDSDCSDNLNGLDEHDYDDLIEGMRQLGLESVTDTIENESSSSDDDNDYEEEEQEKEEEEEEDEEEDPEKENGIWGIGLNEDDEYVNENDDDDDSVTSPLHWDSLRLEDLGEDNEEFFEWEEVDDDDDDDDDRQVLSVLAEEANDNSASISLEDLVLGNERGNLSWEVLLNSPNLEFNPDETQNNIEDLYITGDYEDYVHTTEYEMLFEQLSETEISSFAGKPPTSNSFIKNLKVLTLTKEDVGNDDNSLCCAICKDEMNVGNKAVDLPCRHKYHRECIVPWLGIRNTCPVCRYELPVDDTEELVF